MINKAKATLLRVALLVLVILALVLPASTVYAAVPTIVTDSATDITESTTVINGAVTSFGTFGGPNVYLYFNYATDAYYDAHFFTYDKSTSEQEYKIADGPTTFAVQLTGLAPGTEYHFRAVLRYGTSYVYGSDLTFTTVMIYPDRTPQVITLYAYQDLLEADDCLFVILANIPYRTTPEIPVSRAYLWSLMDTGTELGWNVGYAMNDNGYNYNVFSLYFDAAAAIDWGNDTDYNVQLSGSPSVFVPPNIPSYDQLDDPNYAVTSDTWVTSSNYAAKLTEDILTLAKTLEQEWQIVLLDEQDTKTVLSSNGEKLFRNAIPGIQSMAPGLFYVQTAQADVSPRAWGTSLDTTYKERLLGADGIPGTGDDTWIAASLTPLADWINIPWLMLIGLITLGLCVFVIWKSNQKFNTPAPGYVGSLLVILCSSMLAFGLTIAALITLGLVIVAGYLMFLRRA